jgi:hypothetical protein
MLKMLKMSDGRTVVFETAVYKSIVIMQNKDLDLLNILSKSSPAHMQKSKRQKISRREDPPKGQTRTFIKLENSKIPMKNLTSPPEEPWEASSFIASSK